MKKLITILLLLSTSYSFGQIDKILDDKIAGAASEISKVIDAKIAAAIKDLPSSGGKMDTIAVVTTMTSAGTIYMDTLLVPNNKGQWFNVSLSGGKVSAARQVYILNTSGVYTVSRNVNTAAMSGLTGAAFDVVIFNKLPVVKVTGTTAITEWKLTRINL